MPSRLRNSESGNNKKRLLTPPLRVSNALIKQTHPISFLPVQGLALAHLVVYPLLAQQFRMATLLQHPRATHTTTKDKDHIRILDSRQAMRDNDHGPPLARLFKGRLDQLLGLAVKTGSRL